MSQAFGRGKGRVSDLYVGAGQAFGRIPVLIVDNQVVAGCYQPIRHRRTDLADADESDRRVNSLSQDASSTAAIPGRAVSHDR